jgi:hypothetical protein
MNLTQETILELADRGKTPADVKWCGSQEFGWFSWRDFEKVANRDYDRGYGGQEVAKDLLIVGDSWWLERHEYDGSEWWEYKEKPRKPKTRKVPNTVIGGSWESLGEMNGV